MLSGNGRHRRPRQAPALLVAAGVTGSAIAIPLLGAGGASAAGGTTWDAVAECESGGAWSADLGNGRYGGLQVTQEAWETYGGLEYAGSADQASRSQQIAVAERILADQGVGAWSTCGLLHGLGDDENPAGVDTGLAGDATPGSSGKESDGSGGTGGLTDSSKSTGSSGKDDSSGGSEGTDGNGDSGASGDSAPTSPTSPSSPPSGSPSEDPSGPSQGSSSPSNGDPSGGAGDGSAGSSPSESPTEPAADPSTPAHGEEVGDPRQSLGASHLVDTSALPGTGRHRGPSADESADRGTGKGAGKDAADASDAKGVDDGQKSDKADPSGSSGPSGSSEQSSEPSAGSAGSAESSRPADRQTSRGGEAARGTLDSLDGDSYTVRPGDTLTSIADSLDVDGGWRALYRVNEQVLDGDPHHIVPGQTLTLGDVADGDQGDE
ncbi:transglycosylase family protein [Streptomyces sp. NPDC091377]|uniref:transglycosylase family protein n=1 Tax=Streptomyces sp. NPDC091377 TaxID=3365995 RepID=UPI0037F6CE4C